MSEVSALISDQHITASFRGGRPVTVYLKPSDYCNVGCEHCYLPVAVRADRSRMDEDTLDAAIRAVKEMVERQRAPGALIVWHGGEPLALPPSYLAAACAHVRDQLPDAVQSIQTSLIPYRSEWAPVIEEFFGEIGSSIDFSQRKLRGSPEEYQDFWMSKVEAARADGFRVIPGVVPAIGEIGRGAEIALWMHQRGFSAWNIDRYNSFGRTDPNRPTNRAHSRFLVEVFDAVMGLAAKGQYQRVNTVLAAIGGVLFDAPGDRWGGSCSRDFLVINPDGATNSCPDKISFQSFSNIRDGYTAYEKSEARKDWIRTHLIGHRNPHCATCRFNSFCQSGCPLTPNNIEEEGECSGYRAYLHHVQDFADRNGSLIRSYLQEVARL